MEEEKPKEMKVKRTKAELAFQKMQEKMVDLYNISNNSIFY